MQFQVCNCLLTLSFEKKTFSVALKIFSKFTAIVALASLFFLQQTFGLINFILYRFISYVWTIMINDLIQWFIINRKYFCQVILLIKRVLKYIPFKKHHTEKKKKVPTPNPGITSVLYPMTDCWKRHCWL